MKLKSFLFVILICTSCFQLSAQIYRVDNAIAFYEQDSLPSAWREIMIATQHARTSQYPITWNYFYLIHLKMYEAAESKEIRDQIIPKIITGYNNCKSFDSDREYLPKLDSSFRNFTTYYKENARQTLSENQLEEHVYFQETYIACLDALDKPVGFQYFQLGESNMELRNYEMAIQDFRNAIAHDFRAEEAYLNVLILLDELNKKQEEELTYIKALSLYPSSDKLHHLDIHKALYKQLSFKAKSSIEELIASGEASPDLYMMLGDANDQMNYTTEAVAAYEKAIRLDSTDFYNCLKVGAYYLSIGIQEANEEYVAQANILLERCRSKNPDDLVLLKLLRRLYIEIKDVKSFEQVDARIHSLTN